MKMKLALLLALYVIAPMAYAAESAGKPPLPAARGGHGEHAHGDHSGMGGMAGGMMMKPLAWTGFPMLKTRANGENRENMEITVVPQNIVASGIDAWSNNLKDENAHRQLAMEMGGARLDKPANGGFHWLSAREEQADKVLVASAVYAFNERNAKDPTAMFGQQKHELEIAPQPYPREHSRYRANEDWEFLVRFNGHPLASQKVVLETQNGSRAEFLGNAQGVVKVHFPDDFKPEEETPATAMRSRMRGADFVLVAEQTEAGKTYVTAFNSNYAPDALDKRSMAIGLGFTLLGMLGGIPLLKQGKMSKNSSSDVSRKEEA